MVCLYEEFADTDYVMQVDIQGRKVSLDGSEFVEILSSGEKETLKESLTASLANLS